MITMGKKRRGARRTYSTRRPSRRLDFFWLWLKRFGAVSGVTIVVLWAGAWLWLSGAVEQAGQWSRNKAVSMSADAGFRVANVLVEGRVHTDPELLLAILNVKQGDPLFSFDPVSVKDQIQRVSWVEAALVERRFPDTLYIGLKERTPSALWLKDQKLYLVDNTGFVLTDQNLKRFSHLLMVTGEDAPAQAYTLIRTLEAEPQIRGMIESAHWVGGRRWNLTSARGVSIRLPEEDIGLALKRLAVAHAESGLLDKTLEHIDLRNRDRIIVQTAPGKVQEFSIENFLKAGYKSGDDI